MSDELKGLNLLRECEALATQATFCDGLPASARELKRRVEAIHRVFSPLRIELERLAAAQPKLTEEQLEHFRRYVVWCGPVHSQDCPVDDTCNCEWKPTLDAINALLQAEPAPGESPAMEPEVDLVQKEQNNEGNLCSLLLSKHDSSSEILSELKEGRNENFPKATSFIGIHKGHQAMPAVDQERNSLLKHFQNRTGNNSSGSQGAIIPGNSGTVIWGPAPSQQPALRGMEYFATESPATEKVKAEFDAAIVLATGIVGEEFQKLPTTDSSMLALLSRINSRIAKECTGALAIYLASQASATEPGKTPDEELSRIINRFVDVPSCEPNRFNEFFHAIEQRIAEAEAHGVKRAVDTVRDVFNTALCGHREAFDRAMKAALALISGEQPAPEDKTGGGKT